MADIHYFTAKGAETSEGAVDSVVQYTEADATARGLKFKASPANADEPDRAEFMRLASLDGSEKPESKPSK